MASALLIGGYFIYGAVVEKILNINPDNKTPAITMTDGVDFVPLKPSKIFLIQFLNIAGLGPVFGAILGAIYGPVCLLWIVFGSIFAGGVHDMLSGTMSMRYKGTTIVAFVKKIFRRKIPHFFHLFIGPITYFSRLNICPNTGTHARKRNRLAFCCLAWNNFRILLFGDIIAD